MKFRNYCLVVIGDTKAVYPEVDKVSEGKPNFLDGKGMIISTFTSFMEPTELTDYFTYNNRNFLLFDLNKENSGFFITKKEIHESLFGFLNDMNEEVLQNKSEDFLNVLKGDRVVSSGKTESNTIKCSISIEQIEKMTKTEKDELLNKFIESGLENLTEEDKKILDLLVK